MIWASIKMGWQDKRLILPSVLSVFSQCIFAILLVLAASAKMPAQMTGALKPAAAHNEQIKGMPTFGLLTEGKAKPAISHGGALDKDAAKKQMERMMEMMRPNGAGDPNGFNPEGGGFGALFTGDNALLLGALGAMSWLINRCLEGVTTALVYSHLTEGKGTGRFKTAWQVVFSSMPAIVMLGMATWIARRLATFLKGKTGGGFFGMSMGFVAGIIEVFWTLAGHLILPTIIIEGCSFVGGLKRADKIAQGNLLTIGIGEVGVEGICKIASALWWGIGMSAVGGGVYLSMNMGIPLNIGLASILAMIWIAGLVIVSAMSIYIKSAFYTCLYVWAVEAEAVEESERAGIRAPEPLALALA